MGWGGLSSFNTKSGVVNHADNIASHIFCDYGKIVTSTIKIHSSEYITFFLTDGHIYQEIC